MKEFFKGLLKTSLSISLMAAVACTDDSTEMERPDFGTDRSNAAPTTLSPAPSRITTEDQHPQRYRCQSMDAVRRLPQVWLWLGNG